MAKQKPKQKLLEVEHVSETEITSLNGNLLNEFSIEELEARYETDPLMLSHLFGLVRYQGSGDADLLSDSDGCEKCKHCEKCDYCIKCGCNDTKGGTECPVKGVCEFTMK